VPSSARQLSEVEVFHRGVIAAPVGRGTGRQLVKCRSAERRATASPPPHSASKTRVNALMLGEGTGRGHARRFYASITPPHPPPPPPGGGGPAWGARGLLIFKPKPTMGVL